MKCIRHNKEAEYQCQWCGKQICELCIGKQEGRKIYCHDCQNKIGGIRREKLPRTETKKPRAEDGYIILEGDKK